MQRYFSSAIAIPDSNIDQLAPSGRARHGSRFGSAPRKAAPVKSAKDPVWRFLAPSFLFVVLFSLYPIFESLRLSFYRMILTLPWLGQKFVGWDNYRDLFSDPVALHSLLTLP